MKSHRSSGPRHRRCKLLVVSGPDRKSPSSELGEWIRNGRHDVRKENDRAGTPEHRCPGSQLKVRHSRLPDLFGSPFRSTSPESRVSRSSRFSRSSRLTLHASRPHRLPPSVFLRLSPSPFNTCIRISLNPGRASRLTPSSSRPRRLPSSVASRLPSATPPASRPAALGNRPAPFRTIAFYRRKG